MIANDLYMLEVAPLFPPLQCGEQQNRTPFQFARKLQHLYPQRYHVIAQLLWTPNPIPKVLTINHNVLHPIVYKKKVHNSHQLTSSPKIRATSTGWIMKGSPLRLF